MGWVTSFWDWLMGIRPGFGPARETLRHTARAAMRRRQTWVLPGLFGVLIAISILLIGQSGMGPFGWFMWRVIGVDYLVFLLGWFGGWNMASFWRRHPEFFEELVATNLRPAVVGNLLFSGALPVWTWILLGVAALDVTALFLLFVMPGDFSSPFLFFRLGIGLMVAVFFALLMAWFHLESLRIAYWMFAIAAFQRLALREKAIVNLVLVAVYVFSLTATGCMFFGFLMLFFGALVDGSDLTLAYIATAIPATIGLVLVGPLKRVISMEYEKAFCRWYLVYSWWGAGDTNHPGRYPVHFQRSAQEWLYYLREEERLLAAAQRTDDRMVAAGQARRF